MSDTATISSERLRAAAIQRNGEWLERGFKSHYQLRQALTGNGDKRERGDVEGFVTTDGRFLSRREAVLVGVAAGQLNERWLDGGRDLLSSDINW